MEYRVYLLLFMTSITGYVLCLPETASCPLTLKAVFDQVNCSDTTIQFQHLTNFLNSLNANITGKMCNTTRSWTGNCYKETFDKKAVYTVNIIGNCSIPAFEYDTVKLGGALCYQAVSVTSCPLIITAPFDETICGSTHEKNASLQTYIKTLVGQNAIISSVTCTLTHGFEDNDCRKMITNYSVAGDKAVYKVSVTGTCSIPQWVILDDAAADNRHALCYSAGKLYPGRGRHGYGSTIGTLYPTRKSHTTPKNESTDHGNTSGTQGYATGSPSRTPNPWRYNHGKGNITGKSATTTNNQTNTEFRIQQNDDASAFPWWVVAVAVGCVVTAAGLGVMVYKKLNKNNQVGDDGSTSSVAGFFDVGFDEAPNSAPPAGTC